MKSIVAFSAAILLLGCSGARRKQTVTRHIDVSPAEIEDLYSEAESFFKREDYLNAAEKYRAYLAQKPSRHIAGACYRLGLSSFHLKDYGRVIQPLRALLAEEEAARDYPGAPAWLGLAYYHLSDYTNTIKILEEFWENNFRRRSGEILAALADSAYKLKDFGRVKKWYGLLAGRYPESGNEHVIAYRLGIVDFMEGDLPAARRRLEKAAGGDGLSLIEQARARFYLGKIAVKTGRVQEALEQGQAALKFLVGTSSPLVREIEQGIIRLVDESPVAKLRPFLEKHPHTFPGDLVLLRLASEAYEKGNIPQARAYFYKFLSDYPQHPGREKVKTTLAEINRSLTADTNRLGAVIPLSGSFSVYGKRVLAGIIMGVEEENRHRKDKVSLIIKDSEGDPNIAAEAVWELVEEDRVLAIIGPVLSQTTLKAAPVAQILSCPLITPSAGAAEIPQIGSYIFRNTLTPTHQANTLVEFTMNDMCINEFAILYPNNRYGKEMKEIFTKKVQDLGGKILFIDSYGTKDTDFKEQVLGINEHEPQAIFIPDFYDKVVMIAPQLVFYAREEKLEEEGDFLDIEEEPSLLGDEPIRFPGRYRTSDTSEEESEIPWRPFSWDEETSLFPGDDLVQAPGKPSIQLLGTSGWYSDKLISLGGKYVDNAVFTSGFFLNSPSAEIQRFVRNFSERFGKQPDLLASQAYDTTRMILAAVNQGARTRREVRDNLAGLRNFSGVTGKTGMNEWGESVKEIYILNVRKKKLVQLSGKEKWLCKGGEEINLGPSDDFQLMTISEGIDYEGNQHGKPEVTLEITPIKLSKPKKAKQQEIQPAPSPSPSERPIIIQKQEENLFELEDNL